jgi:hypothetical protein
MSDNPETDFKALFDKGIVFHVQRNEENCTDGNGHDWQGWREFEDARGGETVCARCGMGAMSHSLRYGI